VVAVIVAENRPIEITADFFKFRSVIIWNKCLVSVDVAYPTSSWVVEKNSDLSDSQLTSTIVIDVWNNGDINRHTDATTGHQLLQKFRWKWAKTGLKYVVTTIQNCNRQFENIGQNGAKCPGKNSWKMCEKRMRCCKNYPQTGRIIQPQLVEIKPAKTYRKHRENCSILQLNYWQKQTELAKQAGMSENRTK